MLIRQRGPGGRGGTARTAITAAAAASGQRRLSGVHRIDIGAARIQRPRVLQILKHTLVAQIGHPEAPFRPLADAVRPATPHLAGRLQLRHGPFHMHNGPVQFADAAHRGGRDLRGLAGRAHLTRPVPPASAATSACSLRRPSASSTVAGPAAARSPKMSVADAGIVPGEESGSPTTR